MRYEYIPNGICSRRISFDIEWDIITNVEFSGGCNGNLKAISKLVDGHTIQYIEEALRGNLCREKGTSCADQLAIAVREAYEKCNKGTK